MSTLMCGITRALLRLGYPSVTGSIPVRETFTLIQSWSHTHASDPNLTWPVVGALGMCTDTHCQTWKQRDIFGKGSNIQWFWQKRHLLISTGCPKCILCLCFIGLSRETRIPYQAIRSIPKNQISVLLGDTLYKLILKSKLLSCWFQK